MLALATKASRLIQETNQLLMNLRHFLPKDDLRLRRLMAEAEKLMNADPQEAHSLKGMIYQLSGEFELALHHMDNAIKLGPGNPTAIANKCSVLMNSGFFTEAQKLYSKVGSPAVGAFPEVMLLGIGATALCEMNNFIGVARKMKLDLTTFDVGTIEKAARLMSKHGLCDSDLSKYLDVAGEIMREERVVFCDLPDVFAWDSFDDPVLSITYKLPVDAYRAEELDCELAARLIDRFSQIPPFFSVSFASGLAESNERYPARDISASV